MSFCDGTEVSEQIAASHDKILTIRPRSQRHTVWLLKPLGSNRDGIRADGNARFRILFCSP